MTVNPFVVPTGVDLARSVVRDALARIGIVQRTYTANGVLNHSYIDRLRGRRLFVVEGLASKQLSEVSGDMTLWLLVRETARTACVTEAGETVEQADSDAA